MTAATEKILMMLGGNQPGVLPIVGDDAGTPFAVTVIPVDHNLAVKSQGK
ncbi:hypothetical protein [Edaphobacter aggregans]|nr:hypothetical protein [Edaphobacter aggregans]